MSRAPVLVRAAELSDATAVSHIWDELLAGRPEDGTAPTQVVDLSIERARKDSAAEIVVAELEDMVVGCAYLRCVQMSPLCEERVVHLSHVQVAAGCDRDPVERALLECAVSWAEQRGAELLVAATSPSDREANRFLARLGMGQVGVLRSVPVGLLRTRLPHEAGAVARAAGRGSRSVSQVVAARRSQRQARSRQLFV